MTADVRSASVAARLRLVPLGLAAAAAVGAIVTGHGTAARVAGAAVFAIAALLLEVELPGGRVFPLGNAVVIAVLVLFEAGPAAAVVATAVVSVALGRGGLRSAAVTAAAGAAGIAAHAFLGDLHVAPGDIGVVLEVLVVGGAFFAADVVLARASLRSTGSLYVTLLCTAALLAIAYRNSPLLALVAAAPLLVTRYSFDRLASAHRTYEQTTQALSLLPEVAGLTALGHGERTAVFATALAEQLELPGSAVARVATAARLHHIGHISLHEPEERVGPPDVHELQRVAGELLRETGFLADVASVVEDAQEGLVPARRIESAIVRVCSTLDEVVEAGVDGPLDAVARRYPEGLEGLAAAALAPLHARLPDLLERAREASRALVSVAEGAATPGHRHGHADGDAHDCR